MRPISPDLLAKLNSNMQTPANNAQPRMSVQVSRARSAVVDSTYWTVETIRTKTGLGDISLAPRRLKSYGRPDRIYEIHVDNGIVKTTIREYPDLLKDGWQHQFELGAGSAVAVAFDGEWDLWRKKWRLKTTEKPWIFWIDALGELYTQLWDEVDTKVLLASGVVKVKAMRGWKNKYIDVNDQGVIAGYIKTDGKIYYRNYCKQSDGTSVFEPERQLTQFTGTALNLNLFLLSDYRMGFVIQDNLSKIYWCISERNWAGMALGADNISVSASAEVDFIPVTYYHTFENEQIVVSASAEIDYLYADDFNDFIMIENIDNGSGDWGKIIQFRTLHEIFDYTSGEFEIYDDNGMPYAPISISNNEGLFSLTFEDFNNFKNSILLKAKAIVLTNEAGYLFSTFEKSFLPVNLVPTETPLPEVLEVWNE